MSWHTAFPSPQATEGTHTYLSTDKISLSSYVTAFTLSKGIQPNIMAYDTQKASFASILFSHFVFLGRLNG